jgi:hypothetical protein
MGQWPKSAEWTKVVADRSGFIAATGLAIAALSWFGVRRRYMWAWVAAVAAPVLALAVALPAHYPWGFDTIGHLGLIYFTTAIFVVGALLALRELIGESEASDLQREMTIQSVSPNCRSSHSAQ